MVERRCRTLFSATAGSWRLQDEDWELLHWTARTHEIGMAISHKHSNRHSAYLLRNADLPGFSQAEQENLAILSQGQRGKIHSDTLDDLPKPERRRLRYLLVIIRLAVRFKYVETLAEWPDFGVTADDSSLALGFPEGWLEEHPLTLSELEQEKAYLGRLEIALSYS